MRLRILRMRRRKKVVATKMTMTKKKTLTTTMKKERKRKSPMIPTRATAQPRNTAAPLRTGHTAMFAS